MTKPHGMSRTPTWISWAKMRERCIDPNRPDYAYYGGRGITFCERWNAFQNFYADMGERPEGTTLDRIDNNGDYCPENCRWSTAKEQCRNRRDNTLYTYKGETKCLSEWAEHAGVKVQTLCSRLRYGWSFSQAIETPISTYRRNQCVLTLNGETKSLIEWASLLGIKPGTLRKRLSRGITVEETLGTPIDVRKRNKLTKGNVK